MQSLTFVGNVGFVQELREIGEGNAVLNFSVGSTSYRGGKGYTTWFQCSVWGNYARSLEPHLEKGKSVAIVGELISDDYGNPQVYPAKDGEYRASYRVRVDKFQFLGGRNSGTDAQDGAVPKRNSAQNEYDSIPF